MCLVLLDLSVAFDTLNHQLLLNCLKYHFGFQGKVLRWLEGYLTGCTQKVVLENARKTSESTPNHPLKWGVPQGSVLGLILFTLYTSPLGDLCNAHGIQFHCYADDTQLYLIFRPTYPAAKQNCIQKLETCISEIWNWMSTNPLKLNDSKTEFIISGTRLQLKNAEAGDITSKIGSEDIPNVPAVQNLGYVFDSQLKNTTHINKLTATLFSTLKKIAHIRYLLDHDITNILVQSLIMSKFDYCNSILAGSTDYNIYKLQKIQNTSCRVIFNLGKYDSITPHLAKLHWLKSRDQITYKIAMLVFKCSMDAAPKYLIDLLDLTHDRTLQSLSRNKLPVKTANLT